MQKSATRIFIGSLGEIDERSLHEYCLGWGEIRRSQLMREPDTGCSRGFAFVNFKSNTAAMNFLSASPHFISGRKVVVKPAAVNVTVVGASTAQFSNDLFVVYSRPLHSRASSTGDCDSIVSHHLSNFPGIVDVTFGGGQHIAGSDDMPSSCAIGHPRKSTGYVIVSFGEGADLERCLDMGRERQIEGGIHLSIRRVVSTESELKRKRKMMEEARFHDAITSQQCTQF